MVELAELCHGFLLACLRMKLYTKVNSMNIKAVSLNLKLHTKLKTLKKFFLAHKLLISLFLSCGSQNKKKVQNNKESN